MFTKFIQKERQKKRKLPYEGAYPNLNYCEEASLLSVGFFDEGPLNSIPPILKFLVSGSFFF